MKQTKLISLLLLAALALTLLAGCGQSAGSESGAAEASSAEASSAETSSAETSSAETSSGTVTVVDHAGNTVTLPAQIDRIAVVGIWPLPSVLAVFFNSAEKIVAMPEASMTAAKNGLLGQLYPEILNADTGFMNGDELNTEELLKLDPQVVFYNAANAKYGEQLTNAGFNAVGISVNKWNYDCIETLNHWIGLLSEIFPQNDKAQTVQAYSEKMYNLVQDRVGSLSEEEKARVFFLFQYSDTNIVSSGSSFFGQWWCDAIGAVNVASEITTDNSVQVNMEQVYGWNPDTILITNFTSAQPADLYGNTIGSYDWSEVDAVKNQNVFKMPLGLYRSYTPGADTPVTLLWMAKTVYPDLFKDIDITQEARDYYSEVFGVQLTDEQISSIFTPTSAAAVGAN